MYKVAIIEDEKSCSERIISHLKKYAQEHQRVIEWDVFDLPLQFINNYYPIYSIIFMDIQMPGINGIDVSKIIREKDQKTNLVFVTNLAQYAIEGYKVNAKDFLLKPVSYSHIEAILNQIFSQIDEENESFIVIKTDEGFVKIDIKNIWAITIEDHLLCYHTTFGELNAWSTLKDTLNQLEGMPFCQCNKSTIIGFKHI